MYPPGPVVLFLALLAAAPAFAEDQAPAAPCDPAARPCLGFEGWLLTVRTWTPGGAEPRDLVGARLQAELRAGRWRWAARGDASGIPGEYSAGKWETVRSVEAHLATAYDALRLPGGVTLGPAIGAGAAVAIEESEAGKRPRLLKRVTAGIGARASWPGGWVYVVAGQHQALRGVAAVATWQVRVSDHVASVGLAAVGSQDWTSTTAIAVRFK
jgi:hypothetical protein